MRHGRFDAQNATEQQTSARLLCSRRGLTGWVLLVAVGIVALIQSPAAAQQPVSGDPSKSYFMEYAVVSVLIAAAVFAVGRSSRRG